MNGLAPSGEDRDFGLRFGALKSQVLVGEAKKGTLPQRADALLFGRSPLDNLPKGRLFISSFWGEQPHRIGKKNVSMPSINNFIGTIPIRRAPRKARGDTTLVPTIYRKRKSAEYRLHDDATLRGISPIHPNCTSDLRGRSEGYLAKAKLC